MSIIDLKAAKAAMLRKRHADRVLVCFDKLKHADKREQQQKRSEIERDARNKV